MAAVNPIIVSSAVSDQRVQEMIGSRSYLRLFRTIALYIVDRLSTLLFSGGKPLEGRGTPGTYGLARKSYLGSSTYVEYANYLNKKDVAIAGENTISMSQVVIPEKEGGKNLYAIPVVLQGGRFFADHIVTFVYDKEANTIEYYDSKGLTIADRPWTATIQGDDLVCIFKKIVEKYGNEYTKLVQNTSKHQTDVHSCGMHVLDYIARRAAGEVYSDIHAHPITSTEANGKRREAFIADLQRSASAY